MTAIAHEHHVPVLLDGAQAVPHMPVDVVDIDCDFYVFSAHKIYGPTGIGVLYGKKSLLDAMPPYQGGGDMIETVAFDKVTYAKAPQKFEAGTPDIAGVIGLSAAIDYVRKIEMEKIFAHEQELLEYAEPKLTAIPDLRIIGTAKPKVGVISFVLDSIHPHDLGTVLDHEGIAVRAGHHCAMPLMQRFNVPATVRASFGVYNDEKDINALIDAIYLAKRIFS
jgi:cysteine desulfurase/selenocysteine lyase